MQLSHNTPQVSIITSVYNKDIAKVRRALDSVLKQDYTDYELIIIDDGSNTAIAGILLDYAIAHPGKIILIRRQNEGQAYSLNRGILNSQGAYIGLIDADDEYKPNHISACLAHMQEADLITSPTETIVNTEDDYYVPDFFKENALIHIDECVVMGTFFGRREVFQNIGFTPMYGVDTQLHAEASKKYRVKRFDLRTYIYYRDSDNSIVSAMKNERKK